MALAAAAIPAETRTYPIGGGMGNQNPLQMMGDMMDLRNKQQQWNANNEAGQILASSPDLDTAITRMRQSPNGAWMLQSMNNLREQQLTEAETGRMGAEAYRTRYETGIEALNAATKLMPYDQAGAVKVLSDSKNKLDPAVLKEVGGLYDDATNSLTGGLEGLPPDQQAKAIQQRIIAMKVGSGLSATDAYLGGGMLVPSVSDKIPSATGLTEPGMGIVGGVGGGALGLPVPPANLTGGGGGGGDIPPTAATGGVSAMGGPGTFGAGGAPPATTGPSPTGGPIAGGPSPATTAGPPGVLYPAPEGQSHQTTAITDESAALEHTLPTEMQRLNLMHEALQKFQAGGWAKERSFMASDLQGLKNFFDQMGLPIISDEAVKKLGNGSLSQSQVFDQLIKPFVTGMLRDSVSGTGAGRIREEVSAFLQSADISKDPAMLLNMLNQVKFGLAVGYDRAESWPQYRQMLMQGDPVVRGMYPGDFYSWYNKSGKLDVLNKQFGSNMDMSPYSPKGIKGIEPEKPTYTQGQMMRERGTGRVFKYDDGKWVRQPNLESR